MSKLNDITSQRYGKLVATTRAQNDKYGRAMWLCHCDCGKQAVVQGKKLVSGHTKSCGCLISDILVARNTTHGMRHCPTYNSWAAMLARCHRPTSAKFRDYGAKGVTVCERWRSSFENFFADMGARPPKHSIDRINVYGNYEPANCRWADAITQANNRRAVGAN